MPTEAQLRAIDAVRICTAAVRGKLPCTESAAIQAKVDAQTPAGGLAAPPEAGAPDGASTPASTTPSSGAPTAGADVSPSAP